MKPEYDFTDAERGRFFLGVAEAGEHQPMTMGERMIYATAFSFAWGTRYEEAKKLGRIDLSKLACDSASAAAAAVHVFRIAVAQLPATDPTRPFLDDMQGAP